MYCQAVKADKNKRIYAPYGEGRPDWCPLIEIPPHGRLGDLDALYEEISNGNRKTAGGMRWKYAPTVIEAEDKNGYLY